MSACGVVAYGLILVNLKLIGRRCRVYEWRKEPKASPLSQPHRTKKEVVLVVNTTL